MRILLLSNKSPWPPRDGGASATLKMIEGLSAFNTEIDLLALNTTKHFADIAKIPGDIKKTINLHLVNIETSINPINLLFNLLFSDLPYNLTRFKSREYASKLTGLLTNHYDIIQVESLALFYCLPVIRKYTSAPVVFRPHNIENTIWSRLAEEEENPVRRKYYRILSARLLKLEKKIINEFDAIVPVSPADLKWLRENDITKPAILAVPGVSTEDNMDSSEANQFTVFYIGALDWLPNINGVDWFIKKVWPLIISEVPKAEFIIAGRNASEKTVALFRGPNISFSGEVESSTEFIRDKTVMVVPLFSGSGIRMKIIEGMNHGKPIVASPSAATGLIFNNKKDIFIAATASEFASRVIDLLKSRQLRVRISENAIKNVRKNYNNLASSDKLVNFYRGLIHDS
jgi:glycosyltransferase involved in cell wall biosynthesis